MNTHAAVPFAKPVMSGKAMRFYYYATPVAAGGWQLQSSRQLMPVHYAGKSEAMAAARAHCQQEWEEHGTPYGIRVRDSLGEWMDVLLHGGSEPEIDSSPG